MMRAHFVRRALSAQRVAGNARWLKTPAGFGAASPWVVLGMTPGTPLREVRMKYLRLAREAHPDNGGSDIEMQRLNVAYDQIMEKENEPAVDEDGDLQTERWAAAGFAATSRNRERESVQFYEDLPELMFLYRASGRPPTHPLLSPSLQAGLLLVATRKAGPRFRGCVVRIAEVRGGAVVAYAINRQDPCSTTDKKDWQELKHHWGEMKAKGICWGGPHGYHNHRVLMHFEDSMANANRHTTRTAAGYHYDVDVTQAKRARTVARGSGRLLWGYCGWAPGALDHAIRRGNWRVLAVRPDWAEGVPEQEVWGAAMKAPFYSPKQPPRSGRSGGDGGADGDSGGGPTRFVEE